MSEFERFVQERIYLHNVSPRTVDWYKQSLKWLGRFPLTDEGLKQVVVAMRQSGLQPVSCNNRIRCFNAYLKWSGSPLRVPKLREETRVLPTYSEDQLRKLAAYRPKGFSAHRLHTIVVMLMDTGIRIDEALSLRRSDVNLDDMLLTVRGKGGKERLVAFSFELRKFIWKYMSKYRHDCDLLFPTRDGHKQDRRNVLRGLKLLCRRLGFEPVVRSVHALRHTFALNYLRNGGSALWCGPNAMLLY